MKILLNQALRLVHLGLPLVAIAQAVVPTSATGANPTSANAAINSKITTVSRKSALKLPTLRIHQLPAAEIGSSNISKQELQQRPVSNDLAEIIRRQPGIALTTGSTSGQHGNKRQISIRGMGPENTLILIDGRPVLSRNAVRMGWRGDRNTRGDTNWVPAEMVESIQVLRGPAAARYGNGAGGGVVNIITKKPEDSRWHGDASTSWHQPENSKEGKTRRVNFSIMGPLTKQLSLRLYANQNQTDADAWDINRWYETPRYQLFLGNYCHNSGGDCGIGLYSYAKTFSAGREGVKNQDLNLLLNWQPSDKHSLSTELSYSKQGNLYAGESTFNNVKNGNYQVDYFNDPSYITYTGKAGYAGLPIYFIGTDVSSLLNKNTEYMQRLAYSLSHQGQWGRLNSTSYVQLEQTKLNRLIMGIMGGSEGSILSNNPIEQQPIMDRISSKMRNLSLKSEWSLPFDYGKLQQIWTAGVEFNHSSLNDPEAISQTMHDLRFSYSVPGYDPDDPRTTSYSANIMSFYLENQTDIGSSSQIKTSLRYDKHNRLQGSGMLNPSITLKQQLSSSLALVGGIGQSFKAPNLYQINPNYLLFSRGNGCFHWNYLFDIYYTKYPCFLQGNEKLKPESSINSELGITFNREHIAASIAYFNNDYRNKIEAGTKRRASHNTYLANGALDLIGIDIYRWSNVRKTQLQGIEAALSLSLTRRLDWNNNFTYMRKFAVHDKNWDNNILFGDASENDASQRFDIIAVMPKYHLNSSLNWQATDKLLLTASATFYGAQQTPTLNDDGMRGGNLVKADRPAYKLFDISFNYQAKPYWRIFGGVKNLSNKRFLRLGNTANIGVAKAVGRPMYFNQVGGAGANTYNEPGRNFFIGMAAQF